MTNSAPKKPAAPKQPKKPTSKSKTGNSACSQAASNWQLAIRGKEPLDPNTYKTLAQCRSMSSQKKAANLAVHSGKLNEQGRDALVGRLQKRADQGLLYKKDREARLNMLLKERKAKKAGKTPEQAQAESYKRRGINPADKEARSDQAAEYLLMRREKKIFGVEAGDAFMTQKTNSQKTHTMVAITGNNGKSGNYSTRSEFGVENHNRSARQMQMTSFTVGGAAHAGSNAHKNDPRLLKAASERASLQKSWYNRPEAVQNSLYNRGITAQKANERSAKAAQKWADRKAKQQPPEQPKPSAPAFSLSSGPQFGVNGKNAQGVLFSTPTGLDKQVHADQAARGKPLTGQTSMFDKPPAPSREAALVQKVRGLPGYGVAKASATANRELVGFRMKEKAKPAAPKFSRNGELAPGRGTSQRNAKANYIKSVREGNTTKIASAYDNLMLSGGSKMRATPISETSIRTGGETRNVKLLQDQLKRDIRIRLGKEESPAAPKFSRNGQLAPGRGTEERKQAAHILRTLRQKGFSDDARLMRKEAVYRTSLVTGKRGPVEAEYRGHLIINQARELQEATINRRVRTSTEAYNQLTPTGKVKKKSRVTAEQVASDRSHTAHAIRLGRTISKARFEVGITDPVPYSGHVALKSRSLTKLRNALMPSVKPTPAPTLPAFVAKRNSS